MKNMLPKIYIDLNVEMGSKQKTILLDVEEAKVGNKRNLVLSFVIEEAQVQQLLEEKNTKRNNNTHLCSF